MPHRILRLPAVRQLTGLSRSSIYKLATEGRFPRPLKLGARAVGWLETEIEEWCAAKATERPSGRHTSNNVDAWSR